MRGETVISPPIRGAARSLDITYPSPQTQVTGNATSGIEWINRQGIVVNPMGVTVGFGIPPLPAQWMMYKGRQAFRFTGSGTSGGFYRTDSEFCMYFPQTRGAGAFDEDFRCWRVTAIVAFDVGIGGGDIGLEVGANGNYDIIVSNGPGFILKPIDATHIGLLIRQNGGGAFTVNQAVATVDITEWNMLEMRFIGATDSADATFKAFVNGIPVASFNWGAGTLLPDWGNGTGLGYGIGIGNRGADATYLSACGLSVQASSSEAGLL